MYDNPWVRLVLVDTLAVAHMHALRNPDRVIEYTLGARTLFFQTWLAGCRPTLYIWARVPLVSI